jgi:hypothetical protein
MDFDGPRLLELLRKPAEDLAFEVKEWLDLSTNVHRAKLAQAMIAPITVGERCYCKSVTES